MRAMAFAEDAGGGPNFDLEPRLQHVYASVEARFAMTEPTLPASSRAARRSARAVPPVRGRTSRAPVCELRMNSSPDWPDRSRALTTVPSGSFTFEPAVT